jgi:NAD(P)-dependent dehydrogenase (short-subunit alcohol dehydrogenase family)
MRENGLRLAGKAVIVTGAGQGGGYGAAVALAREGAKVTLVARTKSKLESVAQEITGFGGEALVFAGDVTEADDVTGMVEATAARFGGVHGLVNAAQSPLIRFNDLLTAERSNLAELWESGFVATLELMRAVHPHMVRAGGGSIVNYGSGATQNPATYGPYAAVKSAIQTMSRAAALEWGKDNIRVNVVLPFVKSPAADADFATKGLTSEEAGRRVGALRRIGEPEADIGRAVAFLISDDAAYITGATLGLDGGRSFIR